MTFRSRALLSRRYALPWGAVRLVGGLAVLGLLPAVRGASAQGMGADSIAGGWAVFVDGERQAWTVPGRDASEAEAAGEALERLAYEGYPFAGLDSVAVDSVATPPAGVIFLKRGPVVRVGSLRIGGLHAFSPDRAGGLMETGEGARFSPARLEADIDALLRAYEAAGYLLAEVRVEEARITPGQEPVADLVLSVREGPRPVLKAVELPGAERTRPSYVRRTLGLAMGRVLTGFDPAAIRERLLETGLFRNVGEPEVRVEPDSAAVLVIPVEEEPPGAFDLLLGYQPPAGAGNGKLVGTGHLVLNNALGTGGGAALRLNRLPGRVSSASAEISDVALPVLPLTLTLRFEGLQDSTTFSRQRYQAALGYRIASRLEARATVSREATRPGQAGVRLEGGRQLIPRAATLFTGLGLAYRRVDRVQNPRRGLWLDASFEQGRKEQGLRAVSADGDTLSQTSRFLQARFTGMGRLFLPTFPRQVLVLGLDARLLESDEYYPSDLFRFGGATTLRGYDEERFLGRLVGRYLTEYRYQIDPFSFAFLFADVGYVELPDLTGRQVTRGVYPGFGLGMQYETPVGLVTTSYAVNRDAGRLSGRVHVGLSFGL